MAIVVQFRDRFDRGNGADLGDSWRVEAGSLQIVDQSARQVAGGSFAVTARAVSVDELSEPSCSVKAEVAIEACDGAPYIELFARAQEDTEGSPYQTNRWYGVRLTSNADGTWTLALTKNDSGTITVVTSATVVPSSPDTAIHNLKLDVRDCESYVTLYAYLDDMDVADVSYTDKVSPIWKEAGYFGFQVYEGSAQTDSDVVVSGFEAAALVSVVEFPELVIPDPYGYTYSELVEQARVRLDRSGNSQFSQSQLLDMLGAAEQEIWAMSPIWWWAQYLVTRRTTAGQMWYEMPPYVRRVRLVYYPGGYMSMGTVSADRFFEVEPGAATTTGTPRQFVPYGRGSNGGLKYALWPVPDSEITFYAMTYVKPPRPTLDRMPLLPEEWSEALVLGALDRAFMHDTDRAVAQENRALFARIVQSMHRDNTVRNMEFDRVMSELERNRSRAADLLPVTRIDQLGR